LKIGIGQAAGLMVFELAMTSHVSNLKYLMLFGINSAGLGEAHQR
jgi:hypothetical protein